MEDLIIKPKSSRITRTLALMFGATILVIGTLTATKLVLDNRYDLSFYSSVTNIALGIYFILFYSIFQHAPILSITNQKISTRKIKLEWTSVSKVNIGVNYITFLLNGEQKKKDIDFSNFTYKDIKEIKSKVIEVCEQKCIPFQND